LEENFVKTLNKLLEKNSTGKYEENKSEKIFEENFSTKLKEKITQKIKNQEKVFEKKRKNRNIILKKSFKLT
jgi:hypothetical protein